MADWGAGLDALDRDGLIARKILFWALYCVGVDEAEILFLICCWCAMVLSVMFVYLICLFKNTDYIWNEINLWEINIIFRVD